MLDVENLVSLILMLVHCVGIFSAEHVSICNQSQNWEPHTFYEKIEVLRYTTIGFTVNLY